jgi:hypothetical protein
VSFRDLKVSDRVIRMLGDLPMLMEVTSVTDNLIVCAAVGKKGLFHGGWKFHRDHGCEEDPELRWGYSFGKTGSQLVLNPTGDYNDRHSFNNTP